MYKAVGVWSWPRDEDRAEFDEHYEKVHFPLAEKLPGIRRITVLDGGENARDVGRVPPRRGVLRTIARHSSRHPLSDEWQAMAADAQHLIERYGVTLTAADGEEVDRQY